MEEDGCDVTWSSSLPWAVPFPCSLSVGWSQEVSLQEHRDVEKCVAYNTDCEVGHVATEGQTLACESSSLSL